MLISLIKYTMKLGQCWVGHATGLFLSQYNNREVESTHWPTCAWLCFERRRSDPLSFLILDLPRVDPPTYQTINKTAKRWATQLKLRLLIFPKTPGSCSGMMFSLTCLLPASSPVPHFCLTTGWEVNCVECTEPIWVRLRCKHAGIIRVTWRNSTWY